MLTEKTTAILRAKAEKYNVKRLLLFGSCLHKPEAEAGDIDLAVEMERDDFWAFYRDIFFADDIGKSVDLVDLSGFVTILPIILEDNVVIYEA
jgi:predicted nucleotidyltransferase